MCGADADLQRVADVVERAAPQPDVVVEVGVADIAAAAAAVTGRLTDVRQMK